MCGAYAAVLVGVRATFLPGHLHWITAILAAMTAGAVWGMIPGILKALYNVNEVISCIMMNYICMYMVNFLVTQTVHPGDNSIFSMGVQKSAKIPSMGLNQIFSSPGRPISSLDGGIIIAIICAVILYIVLEKTVFGYELKACGYNRDAAKYAGVHEKRSIVVSMLIAGAAAGIGGALMHLAGADLIGEGNRIKLEDVLAPEGFNGIPVALLAMSNPLGIVFSAVFLGHLRMGGAMMRGFEPQMVEIIVAIIIYFSAFALVFKGMFKSLGKLLFNRKKAEKPDTEGSED
jgi:simple sugar transport system permease protein